MSVGLDLRGTQGAVVSPQSVVQNYPRADIEGDMGDRTYEHGAALAEIRAQQQAMEMVIGRIQTQILLIIGLQVGSMLVGTMLIIIAFWLGGHQ